MQRFTSRKATVFFTVVLFMLLAISWIYIPSPNISRTQNENTDFIKESSSHSKISITGDAQMDSFCTGNGTDGLTPASAYIITNFSINAGGSGSCIKFQGVTRYVVIQNCTLFNSGSSISAGDAGIELIACQNINVTTCDIYDNLMGIYVSFSSAILVDYNNVHANHEHGLLIANTDAGFTAKNNLLLNNMDSGIYLEGATRNSFFNNNASKNGNQGVGCDQYSTGNTFSLNIFVKNGKCEARDNSSSGNQFDNGILGNIYGNYSARYPAAKNDGIIWNTPYEIYGRASVVDHYPIYDITGTHQPISITSNSQLDAFCSGNGTNGTSWASAYIIKNYKISASGGDYCISLQNTDRFLIIQDCTAIAACQSQWFSNGICITGCKNIKILNCSIKYNTNGIRSLGNTANITIDHDNITLNKQYGIWFASTSNSSVIGNAIMNNSQDGIIITSGSHRNCITNNTINNNPSNGITLDISDNNTIKNNTFLKDGFGIDTSTDIGTQILENSIYGCYIGIYLYPSSRSTMVKENVIKNCTSFASLLQDSFNSTFQSNKLVNDSIYVLGGIPNLSSCSIDTTNTVNGKPIYYYTNKIGLYAPNFINAGEIILINCNGSYISDMKCKYGSDAIIILYGNLNIVNNVSFSAFSDSGIFIQGSSDCTFSNNILNNCYHGIWLSGSTRMTLYRNKFFSCGLWLDGTKSQFASNFVNRSNTVNNRSLLYLVNQTYEPEANFTGAGQIFLINSNNSRIFGQNVSQSTCGVFAVNSKNSTIMNINAHGNAEAGVYLDSSKDYSILNCNLSTSSYGLSSWSSDNVILVNCSICNNMEGAFEISGKNCSVEGNNIAFCSDMGVFLSNTNAIIHGNILANNSRAIFITSSAFCTVFENNVTGNSRAGIELSTSHNNTIYENRICSNVYGFLLDLSYNNTIFHNTIANNSLINAFYNPFYATTSNRWYNGTEGNYWGDYRSRYPNATSLGRTWNTPYALNGSTSDVDPYPLVWPWGSITPSAPQALTATAGDAQVILNWTSPANNGGVIITGYNIYRGTTSGAETLLMKIGNVLSYTDKGLKNGQIYYYQISAVNGVGEGSKSGEVSVTPVINSSPNNPIFNMIVVILLIIFSVLGLVIVGVIYTRHKKKVSQVPGKKMQQYDQPLVEEPELNLGVPLSPIDQQLVDGSKLLDDRISEKRALLTRVLAPATSEERSLEEALKPSSEIEDVLLKKKKLTTSEETIKHEVDQQTESEVSVFKKKERCIVCNTVLIGANFICPYCETKYCLRCAVALSDMKENCWTCKNPINFEKGSE